MLITLAGSVLLVGAASSTGDARFTTVEGVRPVPPPAVMVHARGPVPLLAADGAHVGFTTSKPDSDNLHTEYLVEMWAPQTNRMWVIHRERHGPIPWKFEALALTRTHVAWISAYWGNSRYQSLTTADRKTGKTRATADEFVNSHGGDRGGEFVGYLHGAGDLLVANTWSQCDEIDHESGAENASCRPGNRRWITDQKLVRLGKQSHHLLRERSDAMRVSDVEQGHIVVRESARAIGIRDAGGALIRRYTFADHGTTGAKAAGEMLVVLTPQRLLAYSFDDQRLRRSCPLPATKKQSVLTDASRGVAVVMEGRQVLRLVRMDDCRQLRLVVEAGALGDAELVDAGLYYSVAVGSGATVAFVPRVSLARALG